MGPCLLVSLLEVIKLLHQLQPVTKNFTQYILAQETLTIQLDVLMVTEFYHVPFFLSLKVRSLEYLVVNVDFWDFSFSKLARRRESQLHINSFADSYFMPALLISMSRLSLS
jgi:hypothetical protein